MDAFWCHPTRAEALVWGAYPNASAPAGTAVRPLARPFTEQDCAARGDRAWLAGSLALSTPEVRAAYVSRAPERELAGAPETDLEIMRRWRGAAVGFENWVLWGSLPRAPKDPVFVSGIRINWVGACGLGVLVVLPIRRWIYPSYPVLTVR